MTLQAAHYTKKDGALPGNMLDYGPEELAEVMKWYEEHSPGGAENYLRQRKDLERVLRREAVKVLGEENVQLKHPLYFALNADETTTKFKEGARYDISPELLALATYHAGDTFDIPRKARANGGKYSDYAELKALADAIEQEEDMRKVMLPRKGGNYIEGQLWAPYAVEDGMVVPLAKAAADMTPYEQGFNDYMVKSAGLWADDVKVINIPDARTPLADAASTVGGLATLGGMAAIPAGSALTSAGKTMYNAADKSLLLTPEALAASARYSAELAKGVDKRDAMAWYASRAHGLSNTKTVGGLTGAELMIKLRSSPLLAKLLTSGLGFPTFNAESKAHYEAFAKSPTDAIEKLIEETYGAKKTKDVFRGHFNTDAKLYEREMRRRFGLAHGHDTFNYDPSKLDDAGRSAAEELKRLVQAKYDAIDKNLAGNADDVLATFRKEFAGKTGMTLEDLRKLDAAAQTKRIAEFMRHGLGKKIGLQFDLQDPGKATYNEVAKGAAKYNQAVIRMGALGGKVWGAGRKVGKLGAIAAGVGIPLWLLPKVYASSAQAGQVEAIADAIRGGPAPKPPPPTLSEQAYSSWR